jgi:hypothetical protein
MTTTSCLKPLTPTTRRLDSTPSLSAPCGTSSDRPAKGTVARRFLAVLLRSLSAWAV